MGFLKSLFGGIKGKSNVGISVEISERENDNIPLKKVNSSIQDLVVLFYAENYMVGEKKYPEFFRSRFGIGFPNEKLQTLEKRGFIRPSTALESLSHLKATELKSIASKFGIKTSGKKDELCERIKENAPENELQESVLERYWIITEKGKSFLEENKHIDFYLQKHPYSLESIGLDISAYAKLFSDNSKEKIRDILWGEFNRKSLEYYKQGMEKGEFANYCSLLHVMSLFLEEENRHRDALNMYMRYIHYKTNFDAGLSAIKHYSLIKKFDNAVDILFLNAQIYPFMANEIQEISIGCDFDSKKLQIFMNEVFSKEKDTGLFSPVQLTDFVMCGLNGDEEGQKKICGIAMKAATKRLKK